MAFYSVHKRDGAAAEQVIFVREGFSKGAFLLTVLWSLWHRMWLAAAILLAVSGAIALAGNLLGMNGNVTAVTGLAVNLIFGFEARDLQIRALIARGYAQIGLSHGNSLDEAEIRYFHGNGQQHTPPAPRLTVKPMSNPGAPDTLGIFGNV